MSCTIHFEPWGQDVPVEPGRTLLDAARDAAIPLSAVCGGLGTCGKCEVRIIAGVVPAPTPRERTLLGGVEVEQGKRFACTLIVDSSLSVEALPISSHGKRDVPPADRAVAPALPVRRIAVACAPPTLDQPLDDRATLLAALEQAGETTVDSIDLAVGRSLSKTLRDAGWNIEAGIRGAEVVAVRPGSARRAALGIAVDLGTTNVAVYPYRLDSGELTGVYSAPNPLAAYGADIITRLMHGEAAPGNAATMQRVLANAVNCLVARASADAEATPRDVDEMVVVANSGMHHLFLALPGTQLVRAPYVPALRASCSLKARDLGIEIAEGGYVHLAALVGGFVGSDLLAVALSTGLDRRPGIRLALDIGTNTEILLSANGALSACSTASGPALEGAALRYGCLAVPGAIDRVRMSLDGEPLCVHTIGHRRATGICGSGIVDALACMRRRGIVSRSGRLQAAAPGVLASADGDHAYVLVPENGTDLGCDLTITQSEVRAVQLAKGAIRAGMDTLLALHDLDVDDLDEILVAGAFGNYLTVASAVEIGLFPDLPAGRIRQIGNAAGLGAIFMLLSTEERREADALSSAIRYLELARQPSFTRRFAESQWFPGDDG